MGYRGDVWRVVQRRRNSGSIVDCGGDRLVVAIFEAVVGRDATGDRFAFDQGAIVDQGLDIQGSGTADIHARAVFPGHGGGDRVAVAVGGRVVAGEGRVCRGNGVGRE